MKTKKPFTRDTVITGVTNKKKAHGLLVKAGYTALNSLSVIDRYGYNTVVINGGDFWWIHADRSMDDFVSCHKITWASAVAHLSRGTTQVVPGFSNYVARLVARLNETSIVMGCQRGSSAEVKSIYEACVKARRAKRPVKDVNLRFGHVDIDRITSTGAVETDYGKEPFAGVEAVYRLATRKAKRNIINNNTK